jgi:hypothetical protein
MKWCSLWRRSDQYAVKGANEAEETHGTDENNERK